MTDQTPRAPGAPPRFPGLGAGARRLLLSVAFAGTFLAGGLVGSAPALAAGEMVMGHGGQHGDMHAMMSAHIDEMLTKVDATPDQRSRIHEILKGAMTAMTPLHQQMAATHAELHRILFAPTIDRAALEQLRASTIANLDQTSRTLTGAIADAAEVLTPAQRAQVAKMMAEHRSMH